MVENNETSEEQISGIGSQRGKKKNLEHLE